jgi:hypothetical protein
VLPPPPARGSGGWAWPARSACSSCPSRSERLAEKRRSARRAASSPNLQWLLADPRASLVARRSGQRKSPTRSGWGQGRVKEKRASRDGHAKRSLRTKTGSPAQLRADACFPMNAGAAARHCSHGIASVPARCGPLPQGTTRSSNRPTSPICGRGNARALPHDARDAAVAAPEPLSSGSARP